MKALDYAGSRSKSFKEAVEKLKAQGYEVKPGEIDGDATVVKGFIRELDKENSVAPSNYYAPVGAINFYKYYRTFNVTLDGEDYGFINIEFTNAPAKDSQGRTWKEKEEDRAYKDGYKPSISGFYAKSLYEKAIKTQTIDGARFKYVQGFIAASEEDREHYLEYKDRVMEPYFERYKRSKWTKERAYKQGYSFAVKELIKEGK